MTDAFNDKTDTEDKMSGADQEASREEALKHLLERASASTVNVSSDKTREEEPIEEAGLGSYIRIGVIFLLTVTFMAILLNIVLHYSG